MTGRCAFAGHSHPRWLAAVNDQAAVLTHTSNLFHTEAGVRSSSQYMHSIMHACVDHLCVILVFATQHMHVASSKSAIPHQLAAHDHSQAIQDTTYGTLTMCNGAGESS